MGWDISESGFQIVLSADVPEVVREFLRPDVDAFLAEHGLTRADIASWVCHPGGPKVLEAMQEALELPDGALDVTWRSLREVGNLSSTSVLLVLAETLETTGPPPGSSACSSPWARASARSWCCSGGEPVPLRGDRRRNRIIAVVRRKSGVGLTS